MPLYPLSYGGAACILPRVGAEPTGTGGRHEAKPSRLPATACFLPDAYNPVAMSVTPLPDLILYGRPDCGLCAEARAMVMGLLGQRAAAGLPTPALVERDIETDPAWERDFFTTIPVIELGDRRLETVTSLAKVRRLLADVLDGAEPRTDP